MVSAWSHKQVRGNTYVGSVGKLLAKMRHLKGASSLAVGAFARPDWLVSLLGEGPQHTCALAACQTDLQKLMQHPLPLGHNALDPDQSFGVLHPACIKASLHRADLCQQVLLFVVHEMERL